MTRHFISKSKPARTRYVALVSGAAIAMALSATSLTAAAYGVDQYAEDSTLAASEPPAALSEPATALQSAPGASENGIFVYPDGINYKNYGVGWDDSKTGYDMPFFDNMVKALETDFCVNKARVFVAGFSWGGDFVTALVCSRGNTIRAAAANSATDEYRDVSKYATYQGIPCSTTVHPAVRFEHAVGGDTAYPAPRFASTSQLYRYLNSCSTASASVSSSTGVMSCVSYKSCSKEYVECSFHSSIGHALPPNWAKDTWAFFSSLT